MTTCCLSSAVAPLFQETAEKDLQVEGIKQRARWSRVLSTQTSAAFGKLFHHPGSLPAGQCRTLENTAVAGDGVAACPLLGTPGTPVRELHPGSTQQHQEAEQLSAAWTALSTAHTQCWPGHQVSLPPLTKSTIRVLASTWKTLGDSNEKTSHQGGALLLSICFWEALPSTFVSP